MGYTLKTNIANRKNYGNSRSTSKIKYIVVHYTGNDGDTDEANANYFKTRIIKASAHYFVDGNSITQSVPDNYIAWHCGGGLQGLKGHKYWLKCTNTNSIGVELCDEKKNGKYDFTDATINNAVALIKDLMKKYNVPASNVIRHYDVTGKKCPAPFVNSETAWNNFKSKLTTISNTKANSTKKGYTGTFPKLPLRGYFYYDVKRKKVKDKGTQVKYLQKFLNWAVNAGLKIDGSLGPKGHIAIIKYQRTYGLEDDGLFGPACLRKAKTVKK